MSIATLAALSLAAVFLVIQLVTCAICAWRVRPRAPCSAPADAPPITLVRPLCGIESHTNETLEASFRIDYPDYELLFCVACADDLVIPRVSRAMARFPRVRSRLLVGDDPISGNPKLNNMVKGWREARTDLVVFADSNLLVPPDYLARLQSTWRPGDGLVSAPPIGLSEDGDFWGELECAFLNSFEARWQYFVDTFGFSFAQGKTLFYKRSLLRGGVEALAMEPAEDSATTKIIRGSGLRIALSRPPFFQPLGKRSFAEVWSRQCRWARLRRLTFPHLYAPEFLTGAFVPLIAVAFALKGLPGLLVPGVLAYAVIWYAAEVALSVFCGWGLNWRTIPSMLTRDALIPALWAQALIGTRYVWKGQAIQAGPVQTKQRTAFFRFDAPGRARRAADSSRERSANALFAARLPDAERTRSRVLSAMRRMRRPD